MACNETNHSYQLWVREFSLTGSKVATSLPRDVCNLCGNGVTAFKEMRVSFVNCSVARPWSKLPSTELEDSSEFRSSMDVWRQDIAAEMERSIGVSRVLVSYDRTYGGDFARHWMSRSNIFVHSYVQLTWASKLKWSRAWRRCLPEEQWPQVWVSRVGRPRTDGSSWV
jgi:hypothetical protein